MNIEIPPFYVGQEIVAIKDHSCLLFKKGQEFKVTSIERGCVWLVTVGMSSAANLYHCKTCGNSHLKSTPEIRFAHYCFAPKIALSEFISLAQLAEKTLETVGAN